jgi:hypothetical protein
VYIVGQIAYLDNIAMAAPRKNALDAFVYDIALMDIRPIHTGADYKAALEEISTLMEMDPAAGTPEGDRLDILATIVQAYEAMHFPMATPDPVETIKFRRPG